jgi:EAL domain-containing protein (putative c-di-GMP-specific phosphodiesterase class I)
MSGIVRGNRTRAGTATLAAPWVLIIAAAPSTGEWLGARVCEFAEVEIVTHTADLAAGLATRGRPGLVIVDLDGVDREPIRLLWELAQLCPTAARLMLATPDTQGHADAQAFADLGDLLLDLPCSCGQVEIALAHMLGAAFPPPAPARPGHGATQAVARVEAAWRAGRASSCWSVDFSHAYRTFGSGAYERLFGAVSEVVAGTLSEACPGLVEIVSTATVDRACVSIVVAHAGPRGPLGGYVELVERALDAALRRDPAADGHSGPLVVVAAVLVPLAARGTTATWIAAAMDTAIAAAAARRGQVLDDERRRLVGALEIGLQFAFEPIVDLDTGEVFAYRASWSSASASAQDLDVLAEAVGLTDRCDEAIVRGTLRAAAHLEPRWRLLLPVTGAWLLEPRRVRRASRWVREVGLVPAQVVLEIDDAAPLRAGCARELLEPIVREGFGLAVACAGHSRLTFDDISRISPDLITLPAPWVRGLGTSRVRREFVAALRRVAAALDITAIATGADSIDDLGALCELDVRYTTGKIFGRPWVDFAVPRPRGLKQLASIWAGQAQAPAPPARKFDDESGEQETKLRPAATMRFANGTAPLPIARTAPREPQVMPALQEMFAELDACFEPPSAIRGDEPRPR